MLFRVIHLDQEAFASFAGEAEALFGRCEIIYTGSKRQSGLLYEERLFPEQYTLGVIVEN